LTLDDFFTGDCDGLDYDALHAAFPWVRAMADTPQDPRYHGEGDVWTHTRMVCDALVADREWQALDRPTRRLLLTAALLHDAGKPAVTFTDPTGRIRSPEHALRGESIARRLLWQQDEPFSFREAVAALVRHHMQPRYLMERPDPRRRTFAISHTARCDHLAMLARADTRGRLAPDSTTALGQVAAFTEFCRIHDCLVQPRSFASDHARFTYFQGIHSDPDLDPPPPDGALMTIMSGLPGSGKDSWIAAHGGSAPVVSLDDIRIELGVDPADRDQQPVVRTARERAVQLLRRGQDFIWNATTLSRRHRRALLELAAPFDARIRIVLVDAPLSMLFRRNSSRAGAAVVPDDVIWRMTGIWEPPDCTEAHELVPVLHDTGDGARKAS
jgi:predicted kinase